MPREVRRDKNYVEFSGDTVSPFFKITDGEHTDGTKKDFISHPRSKPNIVPVHSSGDLLSRVSAFLPKLAQANRELELVEDKSRFRIELSSDQDGDRSDDSDAQEGSFDDVSKERVIEMNLGIGVLEDERDDVVKDDIKVWIKDDVLSDSDSSSNSSKG